MRKSEKRTAFNEKKALFYAKTYDKHKKTPHKAGLN